MRMFALYRHADETGISGTGVVAEGVEFADGTVVLRWIVGKYHSTVQHDSVEAVEAIHGHGGKTEVVWYTRGHIKMPAQRRRHISAD